MRFPALPDCIPLLPLAVLWPLAACGDLPEPFIGNPGAQARRLSLPETPPMLAVPPPLPAALLGDQARDDFADLLALSLQNEEVPSLARKPQKKDWQVAVSAQRRGDMVVPHYAIIDPSGHEVGAVDGAALSASGWESGAPRTLGPAAQDAAPKILALMLSIRRTRDRANPNSLVNRAAKLFVPIVTGAPGDGDTALTRLVRTDLAQFGPLVQVTPQGADFVVTGKVAVSPLPKGQQQVEIAWTVTWPNGKVLGKVSQLNSVPAGTLDHFWGDVASAAALEASGGINAVVERFIDSNKTAPGEASAAQNTNPPGQPAKGPGPGTQPPSGGGAAGPAPGRSSATSGSTSAGTGAPGRDGGITGVPTAGSVPAGGAAPAAKQ